MLKIEKKWTAIVQFVKEVSLIENGRNCLKVETIFIGDNCGN